MNELQRFLSWLGLEIDLKPAHSEKENNGVYTLLESGQRAKRVEKYDTALNIFTRAAQLAEAVHDSTAAAAITLHTAETYVLQGRWTEAEQLLLTLRHQAQNSGQRTQLAYILIVLGTLSQARGDWTEARAYYEQALKVSQNAGSTSGEARALGHLADTYLAENNASYAVHLLRDALPKLNSSGDIDMSSYFVGQLGRAQILTGQLTEGERLLHRALRLAEQGQHRRFERMWSLELGQRALTALRYDEAQKHYQRALPLLNDGSPEKVAALCSLSKVHLHLHEIDQALAYAQQASDSAGLLNNLRLTVLAQAALGMSLRASGQSVRAIAALEKAAENCKESDTLLVEILRNLAAAQADIADDEAAVETYQKALEQARSINSPLEQAQTHLELGLLHAQRKQMQLAIQAWSAALSLYEAERYHAQVARLYCDIANARKYLGQGQRAMKDFEQALVLLNSIDDWSTRGTVLSNAANAYADQGDIESADAFFTEAITIATKTGNRDAEATRRGNYGWFLLVTGRPQPAIVTLEHAIRISQQQGLNLQVAVQTNNLGVAHRTAGNLHAGLTYQEQALELMQNVRDAHWQGVILTDLADTLFLMERIDEAETYFNNAAHLGREHNDIELIIRALTGQARIALQRGKIEEAGDMLRQATAYARKADMRRLLAEALQVHSQQQAAANHPNESLSLWHEAQKLFTLLRIPHLQPDWLDPVRSN